MPTNVTCPIIDRKKFFNAMRPMFGGILSNGQVNGMEAILHEWEARRLTDIRWLAYILATAKIEADNTFQPIKENGSDSYFFRMYDIKGSRPKKAKDLGNLSPGDGIKYCGRGLVQSTGKANYEALTRAAKLQGYEWDFLNHPDLLLQMQPSIWATFHGMLTGLYTGKKLADYFNATKSDWTGARAIINGSDRAAEIGRYGQDFYMALT